MKTAVETQICMARKETPKTLIFAKTDSHVAPEFVYCWLWSQYEQSRRGASGNNQPG